MKAHEESDNTTWVLPAKGGFRFVSMLQEDHRQPIYGVQFCYWFKSGCELLATTGSNRVSVYQIDGKPAGSEAAAPVPMHLLWAAHDENASESYYSVAWGVVDVDGKKELVIAVAGLLGVIRVLSVVGVPKNVMRGHGGAVNELLFHPGYPHILFSASKDHAIRVWDCRNAVCLARLAGVAGHRDEILTLDVMLPSPEEYSDECRFGRLVSGSLDHMICVWDIDKVLNGYDQKKPPKQPYLCHFPLFSTLDLHADYVDCCRYLPALGVVASRAAKENCILLWRPLPTSHIKGDIPVEMMNQVEHRHSALWWLKFGADASGQILAAPSQQGRISVWRSNNSVQKLNHNDYQNSPAINVNKMEVDSTTSCDASSTTEADDEERRELVAGSGRLPNLMTRYGEELRHPRCETAIRQVAVSKTGNRIVSVSEDGRVWRWDLKASHASSSSSQQPTSNGVKKTSTAREPASRKTGRGRPRK